MQNSENRVELRLELRDIETISAFYLHFNIKIPDYLEVAMGRFAEHQNLDTERELILAITTSVVEIKDKITELDDMFSEVADACANVSFNMQFDKDFEDVVGRIEGE
jgi:hypothetical protein